MSISNPQVNELGGDVPSYVEENGDSCAGSSKAPKGQSKYLRRRVNDGDFKYNCEWVGCSHISSSMNEFNHHVYLHRRGYTQCLGRDEDIGSAEFQFYCHWQDCNAQIEGQIDDFSRHVFYHTFHQYLKFLGQHIQEVEKLEKCLLDTASRNIIPELPEKLMCRWQDCGVTYDNPYIFYSHASQHCDDSPKGNNPGVPVKCRWEGCSAVTKSTHKLKEHIRSHTQAKVVACPTCGSLFASNTRFIDHLKRQNQEPEMNFECSHCNTRFASERILREHMRHHVNHYKCPLCDMTCHSPSAVRDHVRYRHSQERSFQCPQCDYKAKSCSDLRRHSSSHAAKEVLSCTRPDCGRVFKTRKELMVHYNTDHEACKPYECHICSKPFTRGFFLTTHLKEVHSYRWPSGHKRFRYKLHEDGIRRLQTIRYESIEVSQQVLGQDLSSGSPLPLHIVDTNDDSNDNSPDNDHTENNVHVKEAVHQNGRNNNQNIGDQTEAVTGSEGFQMSELPLRSYEDSESFGAAVSTSRGEAAEALMVSNGGENVGNEAGSRKIKHKGNVPRGNKKKPRAGQKQQQPGKGKIQGSLPALSSAVLSDDSSFVDNTSDNQPDTAVKPKPARRKRKRAEVVVNVPEASEKDKVADSAWLEVFYVDLGT